MPVVILIPGGSDPWINLDGRLAAPTGNAQYPTYFTSLNGISPYPVRPPWKVAGVDYRVGINTGVTLADPTTIPSGVTIDTGFTPKRATVNTTGVVLDGYNFSGWQLIVPSGSNYVTTVKNCRLESYGLDTRSTGVTTLLYCEFDGLGLAGSGFDGIGQDVLWFSFGPIQLQYCWFHDSQGDMIQVPCTNVYARYNLFDTIGYNTPGTLHPDGIQFGGDGITGTTADNIKILFNTYVHMVATAGGPSSIFDLEPNAGTFAVMNNPEMGYNTCTHTKVGAAQGSIFYRIGNLSGGTVNNGYVHDNYGDPFNMVALLADASPGPGYIKTGNIVLTTGAPF